MRQCLIQFEMSVEVIWVETFFPPVDLYTCVFNCFDELDRVWLKVSVVPTSRMYESVAEAKMSTSSSNAADSMERVRVYKWRRK